MHIFLTHLSTLAAALSIGEASWSWCPSPVGETSRSRFFCFRGIPAWRGPVPRPTVKECRFFRSARACPSRCPSSRCRQVLKNGKHGARQRRSRDREVSPTEAHQERGGLAYCRKSRPGGLSYGDASRARKSLLPGRTKSL